MPPDMSTPLSSDDQISETLQLEQSKRASLRVGYIRSRLRNLSPRHLRRKFCDRVASHPIADDHVAEPFHDVPFDRFCKGPLRGVRRRRQHMVVEDALHEKRLATPQMSFWK